MRTFQAVGGGKKLVVYSKSSFDFSILYSYMIDQWPSEQGRVSNMELIGLVRI
jgi:hypothetical protein